jgi:non-ribosomal peptide synthetase component F
VKTGAGYVPVDPAYPADRIAFMLADAAPVAVVTRGLTTTGRRVTTGRGCRAGRAPQVVLDDPATVAALAGLDAGDLTGERLGGLMAGAGRM